MEKLLSLSKDGKAPPPAPPGPGKAAGPQDAQPQERIRAGIQRLDGFSLGDLRGFPGTSGGSRLFAQSAGKSLAKQALDIIPGSGESRCLL